MACNHGKKKILDAEILENTQIAEGVYRLILHVPEKLNEAKAGQFVNLYLKDKSKLLPRPISICETDDKKLTLIYGVVGAGTKELSQYVPGQKLRVSSANGNGFDLQPLDDIIHASLAEEKNILLVAGGIGVPPMLELAKSIRRKISSYSSGESKEMMSDKTKLIAILGFKQEPFLDKELQQYCDEVYLATDSGSVGFHGNVIELMEMNKLHGDYYYSCGPKVMLRALYDHCSNQASTQMEVPLQVSLEERMGCGYGACVGCTCKTRRSSKSGHMEEIELKKVCKDGPVFLGSEVVWNA